MKDYNTVTITGTVVKDFGYNVANNGTKVASWDIAVNNGKDKEGNVKKTDFFRCRMFGQEIIDTLIRLVGKGTHILVSGNLKTRTYTFEDKRYYEVYILVKEWKVMGNYKTDRDEQSGLDNAEDELNKNENFPQIEEQFQELDETQFADFGNIGVEEEGLPM